MKLLSSLTAALLATISLSASAEQIVILHTNDLHSAIDPNGKVGGVIDRKAVVDSVKAANKNVILVDAGDMVQGTLYFNFFNGEVEYPLVDLMGYDVAIPGNHDFDNGLAQMSKNWGMVKKASRLSSYDFADTPVKDVFQRYAIKKFGGQKVGFFAVNIDPTSLIVKDNYNGMKYEKELTKYANEMADFLKNKKKCDIVVAVTHIGYPKENEKITDPELIKATRNIDIVIGGHSHTPVNGTTFPSFIDNADGKPVLVAQAGSNGRYLGQINIDTEALSNNPKEGLSSKLIPITIHPNSGSAYPNISKALAPYKHAVDSVNARQIGYATYPMDNRQRNGGYSNWVADFARWYGTIKRDSLGIDSSIPIIGLMNGGGVRQPLNAGPVTEGQILSTFPFTNRMVLTTVKGADLIKDMAMAAKKGGEGISENVRVVASPNDSTLTRVVVDGLEVLPDKDYLVSTLNYVTEGNDDFFGMANGRELWHDDVWLKAPIRRYVERLTLLGLPIESNPRPRFVYR